MTPSRPAPAAATPPATPAHLGFVPYADALRVIASVAVVVIHVQARVLDADASMQTRAASLLFLVSSMWAVPVFFMLSGALLLRSGEGEPASTFYRKRLRRLVVPLAFWTACYTALWYRTARPAMPLGEWAASVADGLLRGEPNYHMWFAFALLGLYIVTPALRVFRQLATPAHYRTVTLFALAVTFLSALSGACRPYLPGGVASQADVFVKWLPHVGYFLLGPILAQRVLGRREVRAAAIVFIGCTAAAYVGSLAAPRFGPTAELFAGVLLRANISPIVFCQSVAVFVATAGVFAAPRERSTSAARALAALGALTLVVYLIHPLVIGTGHRIAGRVLGGRGGPFVFIALTSALSIVLSFAAAFVLRLWRPARAIVG